MKNRTKIILITVTIILVGVIVWGVASTINTIRDNSYVSEETLQTETVETVITAKNEPSVEPEIKSETDTTATVPEPPVTEPVPETEDTERVQDISETDVTEEIADTVPEETADVETETVNDVTETDTETDTTDSESETDITDTDETEQEVAEPVSTPTEAPLPTEAPQPTATPVPTKKPTATPTPTTVPVMIDGTAPLEKELKAGDKVSLGHFEQDNDYSNGAEPIIWTVKKIENGKAYLLADDTIYSLNMVWHDGEPRYFTFEFNGNKSEEHNNYLVSSPTYSYVKEFWKWGFNYHIENLWTEFNYGVYVNDKFEKEGILTRTFTSDELNIIADTTLENGENAKLFAPSLEELIDFFGTFNVDNRDKYLSWSSTYLSAFNQPRDYVPFSAYLTRTEDNAYPWQGETFDGIVLKKILIVAEDGEPFSDEDLWFNYSHALQTEDSFAIRPAMWIDLEMLK